MRKIVLILILSLLISSCYKQELILNDVSETKKVFVVIAHHNLVNAEIDKYYRNLKLKYNNFDNIVIISPNHFGTDNYTFQESGKYCFQGLNLDCVNGKKLNLGIQENEFSFFIKKNDYFLTKEHGIGNHFGFINKYFQNPDIYTILLKIKTNKDNYLETIKDKLSNYDFKGKTLFIASVDFSHHVNEKIAVFHDLNTIDFLNHGEVKDIEVDCPNCLYLMKDLADDNNKDHFNLYNRTSVDKKMNINSNYDNTSHIYGEFEEKKNIDQINVFSGSYYESKFENTNSGNLNTQNVFGMFFGDTHFTRGFTDINNTYGIEDYLKCFYSNNDLNRKPKYWHNRFFYSLDFVGINLETTIGKLEESKKKDKPIAFQTDPDFLKDFNDIGINLFNLSNNHTNDYGKEGINSTKEYLTKMGLNYYGDVNEDKDIFKTIINGTKTVFLGLNDIDNQIVPEIKNKIIKDLNDNGYIVIINIHWGYEYEKEPNKRQQKLAKGFIDNGAKLIIGHHPHVIQKHEIYKGVPIFYSLGNFIFDQGFDNTFKGNSIVFSINKQGIKYNILEFKKDSNTYLIDCGSFK